VARGNGSQDVVTGGSGSGSGTSNTVNYSCSAGEAVGDAVYVSGADTVTKADAASETTAPAIGIIKTKPTPTTCKVVTDGECAVFVGLIPGDVYYLAKGTPGGITSTPISAPGVSQKLGEAKNATTLEVNIDSDFTVLT